VVVREVAAGTEAFEDLLRVADRVLAQRRYIVAAMPVTASESCVLGAFAGTRCVGFLRYVIHVIGAEEGRPPVVHHGSSLTEGFVEAFGVDPGSRRRGIGSALQAKLQEHCKAAGCYQVRSRSPVTSVENYALKLNAGFVIQPSEQNDSYYFAVRL
jgi:GNAT superfamily N-acetyltransferase